MAFELQEEGFRLKDVLKIIDLSEATYHYHRSRSDSADPDREWKARILALFEKHEGRYGYRRIHAALKVQGYVINHKKIQLLMGELNLKCVKFIRKSRYRSYKGKVGMSMAKRPTLDFVMESLHQALPVIEEQAVYRTTIHSDQGWHYQHPAWVKALKKQRIFQSMSRKGTCADNAAMENFFGLLKQEMYYGEALVSYEELKQRIEQYITYYNNERIKQKLAGMSPVQYRTHASQLAA